jgi:hypothetical protein
MGLVREFGLALEGYPLWTVEGQEVGKYRRDTP